MLVPNLGSFKGKACKDKRENENVGKKSIKPHNSVITYAPIFHQSNILMQRLQFIAAGWVIT